MRILQLTVHFYPNIGGVETHLWDLVTLLPQKGWKVFVLCYRPLSVKTSWKVYERFEKLEILRIPWIQGFFYKLIPNPKLEFLYLIPGLFILTPLILLTFKPRIIHAHGLVAGFAAVFWGKIFKKKVIISTHSSYSFPNRGLYRSFAQFIFTSADKILCLSKKSSEEIKELGVTKEKIGTFTYWIDLNKFTERVFRKESKRRKIFTVLFVGRLIPEKGIEVLLDSVKTWNKNVGLEFVGTGPMQDKIIKAAYRDSRIHFWGKISQEGLPEIYSNADVLIVPSVSEEGFGRVIMESLSCGTPVIAANRGAIPEAMDKSVGDLIEINSKNIKCSIEDLFKRPAKLELLSRNARKFAERRYSDKNAAKIIKAYTG